MGKGSRGLVGKRVMLSEEEKNQKVGHNGCVNFVCSNPNGYTVWASQLLFQISDVVEGAVEHSELAGCLPCF